MTDSPWVDLDWDLGRELWKEFAAEFEFRASAYPPTIREPVPSVTWDLSHVFAAGAGFGAAALPVARLVCDVLLACTEPWETLVSHDSAHPSALFRPCCVDEVAEVEDWDTTLFPNGDYSIFVSKDLTFGSFGHPWEQSLCFFGAPAVEAMHQVNTGILTRMLRQDGRPVQTGTRSACSQTSLR